MLSTWVISVCSVWMGLETLKWLCDRVRCTDEGQVAWNSWHYPAFLIIWVMSAVCNSLYRMCVVCVLPCASPIIHGQGCFVCMHVYTYVCMQLDVWYILYDTTTIECKYTICANGENTTCANGETTTWANGVVVSVAEATHYRHILQPLPTTVRAKWSSYML